MTSNEDIELVKNSASTGGVTGQNQDNELTNRTRNRRDEPSSSMSTAKKVIVGVAILLALALIIGIVIIVITTQNDEKHNDEKPIDTIPAEGDVTTTLKTTMLINCPVDDPRYSGIAEPGGTGAYRLVNGQCYFFERTLMSYEEAKVNCGTKFNSSGGILFEPKTSQIINNITDLSKSIFNNDNGYVSWIGVNDFTKDGTFVYTSNNEPFTIKLPWFSEEGNNNENGCVALLKAYFWDQFNCSNQWASICERKNTE